MNQDYRHPIPGMKGAVSRGWARIAGEAPGAAPGLKGRIRHAVAHGRQNIHDPRYQMKLSFAVIVLIPTLIATLYFGLIASSRYVAQAQFAVWSATPARADPLSMLMSLPSTDAQVGDQHIVQEYVGSRPMLEAIEKQFDLERIFGTGADWFSELNTSRSVEDRLRYWRSRVHVTIDTASGICTLTVEAFTPQDALALAKGVLAQAQVMAAGLSDQSHRDLVLQSKKQLDRMSQVMGNVRAQVTQFRDQHQVVDALRASQMDSQIIGALEAGLANTETQIQQFKSYMKADDPRITRLQSQAQSYRSQIAQARAGLVGGGNSAAGPTNNVIGENERLNAEMDIATKGYAAASNAYMQALANASGESRYLEEFVPPALPEKAEAPQRLRIILTVFAVTMIAWCLLLTLGGAIRDHAGV